MKNANQNRKPYLVGSFLVITLSFCAWQLPGTKQKDSAHDNYSGSGDTSRPGLSKNDKDELRMKDLDECMKQLDIAMEKLNEQLQNLHIDVNKEIKEALSEIDFDRMSKEIAESAKKVDWEQIRVDVDKSLKQAEEEMKKVDLRKIDEQMKEMQEKFNSKEFKEQFNSEKLNQQIADAMKNARESIDKAKQEIQQYKEFTDSLEKDGLIDKKKGYKIEWKDNGDLYLNGNKQAKEVSDKYRKYYKQGGYTFKMDGESTESL